MNARTAYRLYVDATARDIAAGEDDVTPETIEAFEAMPAWMRAALCATSVDALCELWPSFGRWLDRNRS